MTRVLFVTWDGPDQRYLEDLFLPIFGAVSAQSALRFDVLQFTWGDATFVEGGRRAAEALGIGYRSRPVLRRPQAPATAAMIAWGALEVVREAAARGSQILFPRSLIPAGMALLSRRMNPRLRLSFDANNLMADERVEFGGWSVHGLPYRILRELESQAVREAHGVLARTEAAKRILLHRAGPGIDPDRIVVAANPRDAERFQPGTASSRLAIRRREGIPEGAPWLVYAGSIGPQYLPDQMLTFYRAVRRLAPQARLHVLTGTPAAFTSLLRPGEDRHVHVARVPNAEVAPIVAAADLGLALREPSYSQVAVAPIKVAEYLLSGTPVLATVGVGDVDRQLADPLAGLSLDAAADDHLEAAAARFLEALLPRREEARSVCRELGLRHFSLDRCAEAYRRVLEPS